MILYKVNPNKLHDEFIKVGIIPVLIQHDKKENDVIAENTEIIFSEDTDMTLVQQIIDAHDPTPLPIPLTKEELLQKQIDDMQIIIDTMLTGGAI